LPLAIRKLLPGFPNLLVRKNDKMGGRKGPDRVPGYIRETQKTGVGNNLGVDGTFHWVA